MFSSSSFSTAMSAYSDAPMWQISFLSKSSTSEVNRDKSMSNSKTTYLPVVIQLVQLHPCQPNRFVLQLQGLMKFWDEPQLLKYPHTVDGVLFVLSCEDATSWSHAMTNADFWAQRQGGDQILQRFAKVRGKRKNQFHPMGTAGKDPRSDPRHIW